MRFESARQRFAVQCAIGAARAGLLGQGRRPVLLV